MAVGDESSSASTSADKLIDDDLLGIETVRQTMTKRFMKWDDAGLKKYFNELVKIETCVQSKWKKWSGDFENEKSKIEEELRSLKQRLQNELNLVTWKKMTIPVKKFEQVSLLFPTFDMVHPCAIEKNSLQDFFLIFTKNIFNIAKQTQTGLGLQSDAEWNAFKKNLQQIYTEFENTKQQIMAARETWILINEKKRQYNRLERNLDEIQKTQLNKPEYLQDDALMTLKSNYRRLCEKFYNIIAKFNAFEEKQQLRLLVQAHNELESTLKEREDTLSSKLRQRLTDLNAQLKALGERFGKIVQRREQGLKNFRENLGSFEDLLEATFPDRDEERARVQQLRSEGNLTQLLEKEAGRMPSVSFDAKFDPYMCDVSTKEAIYQNLKPYQKVPKIILDPTDGVSKGLLLMWGVGSGKTLAAIDVIANHVEYLMNNQNKKGKVLCVLPNSAIINQFREWFTDLFKSNLFGWTVTQKEDRHYGASKVIVTVKNKRNRTAAIVLIRMSLSPDKNFTEAGPDSLVVIDEAHFLVNPSTIPPEITRLSHTVYRAIRKYYTTIIEQKNWRVLLMTATPIANVVQKSSTRSSGFEGKELIALLNLANKRKSVRSLQKMSDYIDMKSGDWKNNGRERFQSQWVDGCVSFMTLANDSRTYPVVSYPEHTDGNKGVEIEWKAPEQSDGDSFGTLKYYNVDLKEHELRAFKDRDYSKFLPVRVTFSLPQAAEKEFFRSSDNKLGKNCATMEVDEAIKNRQCVAIARATVTKAKKYATGGGFLFSNKWKSPHFGVLKSLMNKYDGKHVALSLNPKAQISIPTFIRRSFEKNGFNVYDGFTMEDVDNKISPGNNDNSDKKEERIKLYIDKWFEENGKDDRIFAVKRGRSGSGDAALNLTKAKFGLRVFNHPKNAEGRYIRLFVGDSKYATGVDFKDTRYLHLLDPPTSVTTKVQAIGRILRQCGLAHLNDQTGSDDPNVFVFVYVPIGSGETHGVRVKRVMKTTPEQLAWKLLRKVKNGAKEKIIALMKTSAVDAKLFANYTKIDLDNAEDIGLDIAANTGTGLSVHDVLIKNTLEELEILCKNPSNEAIETFAKQYALVSKVYSTFQSQLQKLIEKFANRKKKTFLNQQEQDYDEEVKNAYIFSRFILLANQPKKVQVGDKTLVKVVIPDITQLKMSYFWAIQQNYNQTKKYELTAKMAGVLKIVQNRFKASDNQAELETDAKRLIQLDLERWRSWKELYALQKDGSSEKATTSQNVSTVQPNRAPKSSTESDPNDSKSLTPSSESNNELSDNSDNDELSINENLNNADNDLNSASPQPKRKAETYDQFGSWRTSGTETFADYLKSAGKYLRDVTGDGNCFYYALSDQLNLNAHYDKEKLKRNGYKLRARLCGYIKKNIDTPEIQEILQFYPNGNLEEKKKRLKEHCKDGVWADNYVLGTVANVLGHTIKIYDKESGVTVTAYPKQKKEGSKTLEIARTGNIHFQSIRPMDDYNKLVKFVENGGLAELNDKIFKKEQTSQEEGEIVRTIQMFAKDFKIQKNKNIPTFVGQFKDLVERIGNALKEKNSNIVQQAPIASQKLDIPPAILDSYFVVNEFCQKNEESLTQIYSERNKYVNYLQNVWENLQKLGNHLEISVTLLKNASPEKQVNHIKTICESIQEKMRKKYSDIFK